MHKGPVAESNLGREFRDEMQSLASELGQKLANALLGTDDRIALPPGSAAALEDFYEPLPESGSGAQVTVDRLLELNAAAAGNTGGPRCFHFVIGGSTPAAMAADLFATALETITYTWTLSPVGVQMEVQALAWLKEMFGLPPAWPGVMVTGATRPMRACALACSSSMAATADSRFLTWVPTATPSRPRSIPSMPPVTRRWRKHW
jgi:hypothetical protein